MRRAIFTIIGLLFAANTRSGQTLSPQVRQFVKVGAPVVALVHVRVIDGTGVAAREDQTVIVSKGRIESVGSAASANVPKDEQVLDSMATA